MKKVIDRGKGTKMLNEVKLVDNMSKNLEIFLEISLKFQESIESLKFIVDSVRMSGEFDSRTDSHSTKFN